MAKEFLRRATTLILSIFLGLSLSGRVVADADTNSAHPPSQKSAEKTWKNYIKQQKKQQKRELRLEKKAQKTSNKHHRTGHT
jgi:hypothetical protein